MKLKNSITRTIATSSLLFNFACKQEVVDVTTTAPVANPYPTGGVSLLPDAGMTSPRLRFHDGGVENNAPRLFPDSPDMPEYPKSSWYVAQWKKTELLNPSTFFTNSPDAIDPYLGGALFAFPTKDNQSHLWIFRDKLANSFVYELYGEHGWLDTSGGSNIFLSNNVSGENSLGSRVDLNFKAKIAKRTTVTSAQGSDKDGSVVSQFISGFTLYYADPIANNNISLCSCGFTHTKATGSWKNGVQRLLPK